MRHYDIVIMHGTDGSPEGNWFPWLKEKMREQGHNVYVPRFPTPENQSVKNWCDVLDKEVPHLDHHSVLIGHSCGATYMLSILNSLIKPVAKSIFVSGFLEKLGNDYFDKLNHDFIERDFDWEKIRNNMGNAIVFHGDNDPYVPLDIAKRFAEQLGLPLTIIPDGGHLNADSGYTQFPQLFEILK